MEKQQQTAIIIGAGPAGLTAALEFCRRSNIKPIVLEAMDRIGGISCTVRYNGNRIDIGGHRFFSKSDRVLDWWMEIMPIESADSDGDFAIQYQNRQRVVQSPEKSNAIGRKDRHPDCVMLVRPRKSRIYFNRTFFDYPLSLSASTLRRLGLVRTGRILTSYLISQLAQRRPENTLEDFLINRFGTELYRTFFKSYTEKVWGVPCDKIPATWGAQRIKGLSLRKAFSHFFKKLLSRGGNADADIRQKSSETSLIERFLYPKYGPGQLWERVAELVEESDGEIRMGWRVVRIHIDSGADGRDRVKSIDAVDSMGAKVEFTGDYFISTMPIRELIRGMDAEIPQDIRAIADGLVYRDFITVGLLVDRLLITESDGSPIKYTWIYIQDPDVVMGRLQIFNNWSPYLVADPSKMWIGLEYFCNETDSLWTMPDSAIKEFAIQEASKIGILTASEVRDTCVIRVPKTYPAYLGTYDRFDEVTRYMERFENLFLVGRNGMHRYNNQDHSMLTAMAAVDNILAGISEKTSLWEINTEQEYLEEKEEPQTVERVK